MRYKVFNLKKYTGPKQIVTNFEVNFTIINGFNYKYFVY